MGTCSWSMELSRQKSGETSLGTLFKLRLLGGTSELPDKQSNRGNLITWNANSHEVWVFCSKTWPSVLVTAQGGDLQTDVLPINSREEVSNALSSAFSIYAQVCHNALKESSIRVAKTYGYDVPGYAELPAKLHSPEDILKISPSNAVGTNSKEAARGGSLQFVTNTQPPDAYLALRTQPNSRQGSRIKIMPNGTLLHVLQRRNDGWWQVRVVPSGEEGWTLSGQGSRRWIECCKSFDPQADSVAITLEELVQKFRNHPVVLSEIKQELRGFRPKEARCVLEYWIKQSPTSSEITINCQSYATGGEADESSVTMIFTVDPTGKMLLTKKDYAG